MLKIIFVVATRKSREGFFLETATGKSLLFFNFPFVEIELYPNNAIGLSVLYNLAIEKYLHSDAILIFAHDDLHILDFYWTKQIYEGLSTFDLVGIVGNKNRKPFQPSWAFLDIQGTVDRLENFSGVIGHGHQFPGDSLDVLGPTGEVKLLDGLFMAAKTDTFLNQKIRFDPVFDFHFYDLDLCRTMTQEGLSIGTIPISLIHESKGDFSNPSWIEGYQRYITKWGI